MNSLNGMGLLAERAAATNGVRRFSHLVLCAGVAFFFTAPPVLAQAASASPVDFNRDIRPILAENCFTCHGPDEAQRKSDLRLDLRDSLFADSREHPAVVPGKPDASELIRRATSTNADEKMPPPDSGRQLTASQVTLMRRWIEEGAAWKQHWSLAPLVRPPLPVVSNAGWVKNPIDAFVLKRLEHEGIAPAPQANREALIRRVTLDLTGLPPTLEEIDAFLADGSPDAYERLVDRLLASPRYGEKMAWEWLDAARYSDTNGYQTDGTRAMWPWRDWLVAALNDNLPFDQFTIEQFAGDLLPEPTISQKIATGFHRNHMLNGEGGRIAEESRVDYVVDRLETTGAVWLGLTVGCARCHDHKYDSLSQREFYRLFAFFNNISETGGVDRRNSTAAPTIELPTPEQLARQKALQQEIAQAERDLKALEAELVARQPDWEQTVLQGGVTVPENIAAAIKTAADQRTPEQTKAIVEYYLGQSEPRQSLHQKLEAARQSRGQLANSILITMIMEERPEPRETFILIRGQYDKPGEKVTAGVPASLHPWPAGAPLNRLGLAQWLVDPANPLTARVTVNRAWQTFFGAGLVRTPEDFGAQGELPSHPELLDWLAAEFMSPGTAGTSSASAPAHGWDVKALHRLIVTSATYRQAARVPANLMERDPENRLLARGPRGRLPSQTLRDQALFLAELLVERFGGPPVKPYQPPGIWEDFSFNQIKYVQDHGADLYRRSLYVFWRRSVGPTTMFDTSARQVCTVRQARTNTPLHALILFNDVAYVEVARGLAERIMKQAGPLPRDRLGLAFRLATGRPATGDELRILTDRYQRVLERFQRDPEAAQKLLATGESVRDSALDIAEHAAYTALASLILNLDEVLNP